MVANFAFNSLKGYQKRRIQLIYGLIEDRRGTGYNLFQSKVAIGQRSTYGQRLFGGYTNKAKFRA